MKMVKSLLLGSAAGLVAMAGAQAADLPVKAKPVQYVKICSLYGAGFYYIPGTDTCIKIGGFVRAEMNFNAGNSFLAQFSDHSARSYNQEQSRARFIATFDARSQTEYGTLRSYFVIGEQVSNGYGGSEGGQSGLASWSHRGFIQWAGFTAGLAGSFFDFFSFSPYSNQFNQLTSDVGGGGTLVFAYTAQFGNGLSASIGAEDTRTRSQGIFGAGSAYAGRQFPDLVGNVRIDQAWGSAQVMGALHQVRGLTYGNEVGWAVGGGLKVNLPWGKGDNFSVQASYSKGAIDYALSLGGLSTAAGAGNFLVSQDGTDIAYGNYYDAVGTGADLELTSAWSVGAGIKHGWNAMWQTSLYGGYGAISYSSAAAAAMGTGDPDWSLAQIGSRTVWTPVRNLALSVDVMYNHVGSATQQGATARPAGTDVGWFQGMFRAQRNFWP